MSRNISLPSFYVTILYKVITVYLFEKKKKVELFMLEKRNIFKKNIRRKISQFFSLIPGVFFNSAVRHKLDLFRLVKVKSKHNKY